MIEYGAAVDDSECAPYWSSAARLSPPGTSGSLLTLTVSVLILSATPKSFQNQENVVEELDEGNGKES